MERENALLALYISLLLIDAESSVLSESEISDKSEDSDSAEAIDLDDNETLDRILRRPPTWILCVMLFDHWEFVLLFAERG